MKVQNYWWTCDLSVPLIWRIFYL